MAKIYSPKFKFKVVIEAMEKGSQIQIARKYGIDYRLLSKWIKKFKEQGHKIFETDKDKNVKRLENKIQKLEQIIGKKEIEIMFLKNFLETDQYGS